MQKSNEKKLLEDALAMIFLLIMVCYVAHATLQNILLAKTKIRVKI